MRVRLLVVTLAALTSVPALLAQQVVSGPDPDRKSSTVFVTSDSSETLAGVSIGYGKAVWQDAYDGMLQLRADYTRLGKGWWTTFDTVGALEIGGTKIAAGSYYLGLAIGEQGAFRLLLFDSNRAMKVGLLPSTTALYTGEAKADVEAPLSLAKDSLQEAVVELQIQIAAEQKDPTAGRLSIRWGRHELSAPVKFHLGGAKKK
jgi:hypothetical protein